MELSLGDSAKGPGPGLSDEILHCVPVSLLVRPRLAEGVSVGCCLLHRAQLVASTQEGGVDMGGVDVSCGCGTSGIGWG